MQFFNDRVFGPEAVDILAAALREWLNDNKIPLDCDDAAIAAGIFLVLFSEGNMSMAELRAAASKHRWLSRDACPGLENSQSVLARPAKMAAR